MPTYEYECSGCGRTFEVRQRISEDPLERCPTCNGSIRRVIGPTQFILKGTGWYVTDYPSEARKKALGEEKKAASPTASPTSTPSTPESSPPKS